MSNDQEVQTMMEQALDSPYGIEISTAEIATFKRIFYSTRARLAAKGDLSFQSLLLSERMDGKLWIIRGDKYDEGNPTK